VRYLARATVIGVALYGRTFKSPAPNFKCKKTERKGATGGREDRIRYVRFA